MIDNNISPFIKWAGGKRQLLPYIKEKMPLKYKNYIEPFIGGGAVLFGITPDKAIINDINKALINVYNQIKYNPIELMDFLSKIDIQSDVEPKEYYYKKREIFNDKIMKSEYDIELASLFIYLFK